MLDVRRLHTLTAVIDEGSITAAAAALGYTPSAVSQSVAALERDTKTALLEKAGRGIRPTQAALLLSRHARSLLAQLQEAERDLEALRAGEAGRLRLGAFATAGAALVPRAVARFKETYPRVELDLSMVETDEALAQLRCGHIDVAVIADGTKMESGRDNLVLTPLLEDPYRVVLPRNHPAATKQVIALEDLRDEPWISTASARCNCLQTITTACARAGFAPRFAVEADEFATTVGFVNAGLGVAMVPLLALSSIPDSVRVCRIEAGEPKRYVYAVSRVARSEDPIVEGMKEALRLSAGSHLQSAA